MNSGDSSGNNIEENENNILSSIASNINIGDSNNVDDCFYYSSTLLSPSVVTHSISGNFRNTFNQNKENKIQELIFVKENCFELLQYYSENQSLESIALQPTFSIIKDIKVLTLPTLLINNNNNNNNNSNQNNTINNSYGLINYELNDLNNFDQNFREKDFIIVTSDSGYLSVLAWSNIKKQFLFVQHLKISPPGYSFKYLGDKIQISQCNRILGVSALKNKLSLFLINNNSNSNNSNNNNNNNINNNQNSVLILLPNKIDILDLEGDIYSFNFSYEKDDPYYLSYCYINILIIKNNNQIISKYKFNFNNKTITKINNNYNNLFQSQQSPPQHQQQQILNYQIINIPKINFISSLNYNYYFLLLLNNKIIFTNSNYEKLKEINIYDQDFKISIIQDEEEYEEDYYKNQNKLITSNSWHQIDSRYYLLLGNEMGNLYGIEFLFDSNSFKCNVDNSIQFDFKFNPIQGIINLNNNYFGIIGDLSDGGIYEIDFNNYKIINCSERIENHSGIIDFEIQKQKFTTKIYACCGGSNSIGSLKVIENSIPTNIQLIEKRIGSIYVWSFNPYIVIGYPSYTVVQVSETQIENNHDNDEYYFGSSNKGDDNNYNINFIEDQATIYCYRTIDGTFVQVTPTTIVLFNPKYSKKKRESYHWCIGENSIITNACSRDSLLLVSASKPNSIISFKIIRSDSNDHGLSLEIINSIPLDFEISCISLPIFNEFEILDKEIQLFNLCIIGTYLKNILLLNFKFNKILYSFDDRKEEEEEEKEDRIINAIPNSIILSILNELNQNSSNNNSFNQKEINNKINFKLVCGLRDGQLLKFDILYNLKNDLFKVSKNIYSKLISNSPVTILPVSNQGAMVLTDQPYYITSINNHISLSKVSFKNDKMISYCSLYSSENSRLSFLFVNPEFGLFLANVDFSKKLSVKTLSINNSSNNSGKNNHNQINKQNPNRILLIEKYSILVVLNDNNISVLVLSDYSTNFINNNNSDNDNELLSQSSQSQKYNSNYRNELNYKKIFQTKEDLEFKTNHSIKYWDQKNLIIVYGNVNNEGLIYFYSIQFNHTSCGSEEISLNLEKKRKYKPIASVLPFVDGKYLVFTSKENLMIDYNNDVQLNFDDIQTTPVTVSKFRSSDNKLVLGTETNGLEIYKFNQADNSFILVSNEKSKFISDSIFLANEDQISTIDKYGNFKILNLNQVNEFTNNLNLVNINNHINQINQINQDIINNQQQHQQQQQQQQQQPQNLQPQQQLTQEQQQIQQLQQQLQSIPVILESINQFSLKESCLKLYQLNNSKIITCSLLGSVILFGKLSRVEYKLLFTIQNSLLNSNNSNSIRSITNNDLNLYRSEISKVKNVLDGDLLYQFLYLEEMDQINLISKLFKLNDNPNVYLVLSKIISLLESFKLI